MASAYQNSRWMVRFPLRRDFAWEAGFVDAVREPIGREHYESLAELVRATGGTPRSYEDLRRELASYVPPRYLGYGYATAAGARLPSPRVSDGVREVVVQANGLWEDLAARINRALCVRRERPSIIVPVRLERPAGQTLRPKYFVLHDTRHGVAGLYAWVDRFDYLDRRSPQGRLEG